MNQQEKPSIQTIKHKNNKFDIKVTYQKIGNSQKIDIYLKSYVGKDIINFKSTFTNQTIPQEIISIFASLDIVFECFKDENSFQVNLTNGKIFLKGIFEIKGRKIERKAELGLQKYDISEYQNMFDQIQQLENEVAVLKKLRTQAQWKFNKNFQQKYEQQKRKFEQVIHLKQQEQKKMKERQKQLQYQISQMRTQISILIKKIDSFANQHFLELKRLKQKSSLYEKIILKNKQQSEELILLKKGFEGRKLAKTMMDPQINQNMKQNNKVNNNCIQKQLKKNVVKSHVGIKNSPFKFIDQKSQYLHKFKIKDNLITYIGQNNVDTQLLMKNVIPRNKKYGFEFKILKTKSRAIMIGVIDQHQAQKNRFSDKRSVSYWGKTGYIWGGEEIQGEGFKEGDVVQVTVQLNAPFIQWRVNGVIEARCQPKFFKDSSKCFVPFVEMETEGDCVLWNDLPSSH